MRLTLVERLTEGVSISMCIVGFEPRTTFSDDEIKALHKFAVIAVREIELWTARLPSSHRHPLPF